MDLVHGAKRVLVMMENRSRSDEPKILEQCTLPLTGLRCVHRIITDMAVMDVGPEGLILTETAPGIRESDVRAATGADFRVAADLVSAS